MTRLPNFETTGATARSEKLSSSTSERVGCKLMSRADVFSLAFITPLPT